MVCSVANFDRSLPADRVNNVRNDESLKPEQKEERIG